MFGTWVEEIEGWGVLGTIVDPREEVKGLDCELLRDDPPNGPDWPLDDGGLKGAKLPDDCQLLF